MVSSLTASSQFPHILPSPHHIPPYQSSQGDVRKIGLRSYHFPVQNSSASRLPNLLPCLLTQHDCPPLTCPPSLGVDNPYSLCSTHTTTFQPLEPTKVISAPGPLHLQFLLPEVFFPSLHSLSLNSQLKPHLSKELFPGYSM